MVKISFALLTLASALFASSAFARKATVCTVTINSSDERELFKKTLNPRDFEFVELTRFGEQKIGESWFEAACAEKIQCDVLLVSAHFGGSFFGTMTDFKWTTDTIENKSCQNSCDGILKNPKEVYLFGCNTLAGKQRDRRTPEEYLQVLLRDNIDRQQAERIVAARYGPFGSSFGDVMARNFETVPMIYGFDSVGPSGTSVKKYLKSYLTKVGDFKKHLALNDFERSRKIWQSEMRATNHATATGLQRSSPAYEVRTNLCELRNEKKRLEERVNHAEGLLDKDFQVYLPSVADFINRQLAAYGRGSDSLGDSLKSAIYAIRDRTDLAQKMKDVLGGKHITPTIRLDLLQASALLGWKNQADYEAEVTEIFTAFLTKPKTEDADFMCSQMSSNSMKRLIPRDRIMNFQFDNLSEIRIAACYGEYDIELAQRTLRGYILHRAKFPSSQNFEILMALDSFKGIEEEAAFLFREARSANLSQDTYLKYRKLKYTTGAEQVALLQSLSDLTSPDALRDIAESLAENPLKNETVSRMYFEQVFRSKAVSNYDSYIKSMILIPSTAFQDWFAEKLLTEDPGHTDATALALSTDDTPILSTKLSGVFIRRLQQRLENKDGNTDQAFAALARAPLTLAHLEQLYQMYKQLKGPRDQIETVKSYLRHILSTHADNKLELEEEILSGKKFKYVCEIDRNTGGRHCFARSYN